MDLLSAFGISAAQPDRRTANCFPFRENRIRRRPVAELIGGGAGALRGRDGLARSASWLRSGSMPESMVRFYE
ncbi:hypothetical protein ABT337_18740 [Saccharopolyspora hirsuta]|uniref:hypothetical protein n=1 Tax=Saccharopolyspora hirsuta TaxID=1837 RepID=UPI00332374DD